MKYTDDQIVALAESHEDNALKHHKSVEKDNESLWAQYRRELYGDEVEGRAKYVAGDVQGVVDWTTPDLVRLFMDGDEIATFEQTVSGDEAEKKAKDESQYCNHIFLHDNDGYKNLRDYVMNGLISYRGYLAVWWEGPQKGDAVKVSGIMPEQLPEYLNNVAIEINQDSLEEGEDETLGFEYHQIDYEGALKVTAPSFKNVLVSRGFDDEDEADYVCLRDTVNRSDLIKQFPEKRKEIDRLGYDEETTSDGSHLDERDDVTGMQQDFAHSTQSFVLLDEYIRLDLNDDGINELINIKRVGKTILEKSEVDMQPICSWSSRPEPDTYYASSLAESAVPSQRVRSVSIRAGLDSMRLATMPRVIASDGVNMNDLLNMDLGAVIRTNTNLPVGQAVAPMVVPDMSQSALLVSENEEKEREFVTGIPRQATGLDPDALTDTYGGMQLLQNAASARKEVIAREAGAGMVKCFNKIAKLLRRHHDYKREIKQADEFATMEPTSWLSKTTCKIDIGVGTGSREANLGRLQIIEEMQSLIVQGMPESGLVDAEKVYNLASRKVEAIGFNAASEFFNNPKDMPPQEPQPDPEMEKVKAEQQMKQAEMQAAQQAKQAEMQMKAQEQQQAAQLKMQEAQQKLQLAREEAQAKAAQANQDAQQEMALAVAKAEAEMALAEQSMAFEQRMAVQQQSHQQELATSQAAEQAKLSKNRPGGDLNK